MRMFSLEERKQLYKDAWWDGTSIDIDDLITPDLTETEKRNLRRELEAWTQEQIREIERIEAETDWDTFWDGKILPYIQAPKSRPPIWQRIRSSFLPKKKAYADQVQQTLAGYIPMFSKGKAVFAGNPLYELPEIEGPSMNISIHFTRSTVDDTHGTLYLRFQIRDNGSAKVLNGIRLELCNSKGESISPRKQAKIRSLRAEFSDIDLTRDYTVHAS
ncbi:hypothetical protein ACFL6S_21635 [Candidatus Poribacteria bacterium]